VSDNIIVTYLDQLRRTLPYVPPISIAADQRLYALHQACDYEGIVRFVRRTMNLEVSLVLGLVNGGGPKSNPDAPAWVELPQDMPFHGTEAFKKLKLKLYLRKSFLKNATYDQVIVAVAHELSHIVLDSIQHPLRQEEKAVDLTAMLLGFCILYASACYKEWHSGNSITYRTLGYLRRDEVELANQILARNDRVPKSKTIFNIVNAIDMAVARFVLGVVRVIVGTIAVTVVGGTVAILISSLFHGEFHIPGRQPSAYQQLHSKAEGLLKRSPLNTAPKAP
jgi:hypothetical protein